MEHGMIPGTMDGDIPTMAITVTMAGAVLGMAIMAGMTHGIMVVPTIAMVVPLVHAIIPMVMPTSVVEAVRRQVALAVEVPMEPSARAQALAATLPAQ